MLGHCWVKAGCTRSSCSDHACVRAGTYHDYVLYSDGGPADNTKRNKFRGADKQVDREKALKNMQNGVLGTIEDTGKVSCKSLTNSFVACRLSSHWHQPIGAYLHGVLNMTRLFDCLS